MSVNWRMGHSIRIGGREVGVTILEEYRDPGSPLHMKVIGAGGVHMEGSAEDIVKRLEQLGVTPPLNPALAAARSVAQPPATSDIAAAPPCDLVPASVEPRASQAASAQEALVNEVEGIDAIEEPQRQAASTTFVSDDVGEEIETTADEEIDMTESEDAKESAASEHDEDLDVEAAAETAQDCVEDELDEEQEPESPVEYMEKRLLRMLKQPMYTEDPPLEMSKFVSCIPHLASTQEAATFIEQLDENIRLDKMKAVAARRARNLKYLKRANRARRCGHVKFNGMPCGAPALRGQQFCQFHAPAHVNSLDLPVIEDQQSLQMAYTLLAQQTAANKIDPGQAKVLLQILDSAGRNLSKSAGEYWEQVPTPRLGGIVR